MEKIHYLCSVKKNNITTMEKTKIFKILKKYADYTSIPYAADLCCPNGDMVFMTDKPNLVGWCESNIGHMMVLECPKCFKKFRFHATDKWDDTIEEFERNILRKLRRNYFNNSEEINKLLNE